MDYFFDKYATIYDTTIVNIDGEDTKSYEVVYSDIPCDFYTPNNTYGSNRQAREFETQSLNVVFNGKKTITKGQKITLKDSEGVEFGNYVINSVVYYKTIYGQVDNTTLSVSERDVG